LAITYAVLDKIVTPFAQPFSLNNASLQYPYADPERIPIWLALVISGLFPGIAIAVYTLFLDGLFSHHRRTTRARTKYTFWDRLWELNCGWLGLLLSQGAAFVITGSLKNLIGKPRPDIIARCKPDQAKVDALAVFTLATKALCTEKDEHIMQDGFRSFPSGHSSSSFAGLFYLSLYLAAKLHVLDQRGEVWRTFIVLVPTLAASCVAGSRIMDARHHPFDVLFGSLLGILVAWASYRQYFPPVHHVWEKGRAYPMRTWGTPIRRPVRGRVIVDGETLEVLDDRVPVSGGEDDDSRYEMDFTNNNGAGAPRHAKPEYSTTRLDRPDLDLETGYPSQSTLRQDTFSSVSIPAPLKPSSTGNAFREQMEQNRRMRTGGAAGSPEREVDLNEDEPLQRGRA
jgi:diacylglycerol diphosphate phosphatase/phosphatidate phosphatase